MQQELTWKVRAFVLLKINREIGRRFVPVGVSNRHIHLSMADIETLFGFGYALQKYSPLSQPGQFAAVETVTLQGPKGKLGKVRVLGPARPETQVEISVTDSFALGIKPPVRMSGDLKGTPGILVIGPKGSVQLSSGVMIASRHMHISAEEAKVFGLKNGDIVKLRATGKRGIVFENVLVRSGNDHEIEAHFDVDEANAAHLKNGEMLEIVP